VTEIIETRRVSDSTGEGWTMNHRVLRDDGEEVSVAVRCNATAEPCIKEQGVNAEALAAVEDRGEAAALSYAESAQSPAIRGAVTVTIESGARSKADEL
jgi:hypothetical protein